MRISIQITNKIQKYIIEGLKDNDIESSQKNFNRVLKELKIELTGDLENIIDDIIMDISNIKSPINKKT